MLRQLRSAVLTLLACTALSYPGLAAVPHLQDQNGHAFSLEQLQGQPTAVTFVATHCKDACPLINAQFSLVARDIERLHIPMRLVSITLDPEHDTLRDMHELARVFSAKPETWILASGKAAEVHAVMQQFGVVAERGPDGYADVHSTFVYILDRHGRPRKTLLASNVLQSDLLGEVQREWRDLTR